jgi:putative transposase
MAALVSPNRDDRIFPGTCHPGYHPGYHPAFHIVQRGIARRPCFRSIADYRAYLLGLQASARHHGVALHAWVLMEDHVHLLASAPVGAALTGMLATLVRQYSRHFTMLHGDARPVWQARYRSCPVPAGDWLLNCYRYIELNPVRASLVTDPGGYHWSSYRCNAQGVSSGLCSPHRDYLSLADGGEGRRVAYRRLVSVGLPTGVAEEIRRSTFMGSCCGESVANQANPSALAG